VNVHLPGRVGRYTADQLAVYYSWPKSVPYQLQDLSGFIEVRVDGLVVNLSQTLNGTTSELEMNGSYVIGNPGKCA
jgi:hypothetical protein